MNKSNQHNMNATTNPKSNEASSGINCSGPIDVETLVFSTEVPSLSPEKAMAGGVLRQAAYDLRRFRGATGGVERQLYLDAYDWIRANDYSWPFSFVNICQSLQLELEITRRTLFEDASLGPVHYWGRRCGRAARSFQTFLNRVFTTYHDPNTVDPIPLTVHAVQ
jgi:hypothetical protein